MNNSTILFSSFQTQTTIKYFQTVEKEKPLIIERSLSVKKKKKTCKKEENKRVEPPPLPFFFYFQRRVSIIARTFIPGTGGEFDQTRGGKNISAAIGRAVTWPGSLRNNCWRGSVIESIGIIAFMPAWCRARTNCSAPPWNTNELVSSLSLWAHEGKGGEGWAKVSKGRKKKKRKRKWVNATQHFYPCVNGITGIFSPYPRQGNKILAVRGTGNPVNFILNRYEYLTASSHRWILDLVQVLCSSPSSKLFFFFFFFFVSFLFVDSF